MREDWNVRKLKEVCEIGDGNYSSKYPKASEFMTSGIPFITATNLKNGTIIPKGIRYISEEQHCKLTKGHIKEGDLVVVVRGSSTGNSSLVPAEYENSNLNSQLAFLRTEITVLNSNYLYYVFNSPKIQRVVNETISGSAQPQLPNNKLLEIKIPIPLLSEQKQIVKILDEAFTAIDKAKANIEKNIHNAKELFQSKLNDIFSQKGDGWEEKKLLEVITLKSGKTFPKSLERSEGEIPYLKVSDMNIEGNEFEITTSTKFVSKSEIKDNNILPSGTIIFPKRGGAIATNKKRITVKPICVDLNTMGAIASSIIYPEYLYFYFRSFDLMDISNGTTIPQINNYSFEPLKISIPKDKSIQLKHVKILEILRKNLNKTTEVYTKKLDGLENLKKSILQKAFAGELTNKTVEV